MFMKSLTKFVNEKLVISKNSKSLDDDMSENLYKLYRFADELTYYNSNHDHSLRISKLLSTMIDQYLIRRYSSPTLNISNYRENMEEFITQNFSTNILDAANKCNEYSSYIQLFKNETICKETHDLIDKVLDKHCADMYCELEIDTGSNINNVKLIGMVFNEYVLFVIKDLPTEDIRGFWIGT